MLLYDVNNVNSILNMVYSNMNIGSSTSYDVPIDEEAIDRKTFDAWLASTGVSNSDVENVDWATACFRIEYLRLFSCNSCICVPPMMLYMGFGVIKQEKAIFNTQGTSNIGCCC